MNAVVTLLIGVVAIALGYGYYARTINKNIIKPEADASLQPSLLNCAGKRFAYVQHRHFHFSFRPKLGLPNCQNFTDFFRTAVHFQLTGKVHIE